MPESPIRCVCFDWGGVILRICRGFEEGVRAAGLDVREGVRDLELYAVRKRFSSDYQVGRIGTDAFFEGVSDSMSGLYTPQEIALIHDAWLLGEYPGVAGLVADLHATEGVSTAMLSNTNERHWARRLGDFPTSGILHHQHASHLLGHCKPDEAIFRAFERETGFAPAEILFFDDLAENIEAARSAGWSGFVVDHTGDTASQMRACLKDYKILSS